MAKRVLLLAVCALLLLGLTACGGQGGQTAGDVSGSNGAASDASGSNDAAAGGAQTSGETASGLHLAVDEGVTNCLRITTDMYVSDGGDFYAGTPYPVLQMQVHAQEGSGMPVRFRGDLAMTENGQVYLLGDDVRYFAGENVVFADSYRDEVVAVTADGRMLYGTTSDAEGFKELSGQTNVKYATYERGGGLYLVCVYGDGTAALLDPTPEYGDCAADSGLSLAGWSDIAWAVAGKKTGAFVIGLKNDGTIVAEGAYPEEILSWTDMVYVDFVNNKVIYGLKSDGSVVMCSMGSNQEYYDELVAAITKPLKAFSMSFSYVGIDAEGQLVTQLESDRFGFCLTRDLNYVETEG